MVLVKYMVVGKSYKDNVRDYGKLSTKHLVVGGAGGSGNQEPSFNLTFEDGTMINKPWDDDFTEITVGGKRKSRRNKKSRKIRRKSSRR